MNRISSLDGLRAVSIALVLFGHLGHSGQFPHALQFVTPYANLGVRVFFVISGFLITHLLLQEREISGQISLPAFYFRRAFRIFPAAYFYLAVIFLLVPLSAPDRITSLTYTVNFHPDRAWVIGHLWSLSVEEQFYLLWPAALFLSFSYARTIAMGTMVLAPLARAITQIYWPRYNGEAFPTIADALSVGCLMALFWPQLVERKELLLRKWVWLAPVFCLLLAHTTSHPRIAPVCESLLHISIALTIANCVLAEYRWLNWPAIKWFGVLSYSLYLWQQPFFDRSWNTIFTTFPLNVLSAVACASLSHYLVEKPWLRLRTWLESRFRTEQTTLIAPVEAERAG